MATTSLTQPEAMLFEADGNWFDTYHVELPAQQRFHDEGEALVWRDKSIEHSRRVSMRGQTPPFGNLTRADAPIEPLDTPPNHTGSRWRDVREYILST